MITRFAIIFSSFATRQNISANTPVQQNGYFKRLVIKASLCAVLSVFLFITVHAQVSNSRRKENFDIQKFSEETVNIAAPSVIHTLSNINSITVIDARADTASIGLMQKKVIDPILGALNNAQRNQAEQRINKKPTFIMLENGLQAQAKQFAAGSFIFPNNKNGPAVLMVIKKLWLSDELNLDEQPNNNSRFAGTDSRDVWTSGADVKIEFYLEDYGHYFPLYRYDSVISKAVTVSEYAPEYLAMALRLSLQKIVQMDAKVAGIMTRRKFSLEEINRHNESDFNLPVLKDAVLKKGVYMSFEEFKNNNPSQTEYDIKKDRLTDIVYIKQAGGTEYAARHVWGYCDGLHAYIRSANNFFLLQRSSNAFYIFGAKNVKRTETKTSNTASYSSGSNGVAAPVTLSNSKTFVPLEPFQLDWSTGKLY